MRTFTSWLSESNPSMRWGSMTDRIRKPELKEASSHPLEAMRLRRVSQLELHE